MKVYLLGFAMLTAGLAASPAQAEKRPVGKSPGNLAVLGNNESKVFSQEGIDKAKATMSGSQFDRGLNMTIDTYAQLPENKKAGLEAAGNDPAKRGKFFHDWAVELAKNGKEKGPFVLICRKPGHITVIVDRETRGRGFTSEKEKSLGDIFLKGFREAKGKPEAEQLKLRDATLSEAVSYVVRELAGTTVDVPPGAKRVEQKERKQSGRTGLGIGGWVCLGIVALLGIWLVIGVFRALTGGGGGGGGGGMTGGGGGGGGFLTSLFGGLFGAMAGMWIYNSFFGHGSMFGGSSDAYASDGNMGGGDGGNYDTGAGDYSGDAGYGGDYGGGGGDFGGGGDDFGGGDF